MIGIIDEKKQAISNKGNEITSAIIESVIDYAVESIERSLRSTIDQLFRRIPLPRLL